MSQASVLDFLKSKYKINKNKFFTINEIRTELKQKSLGSNLKKLREYEMIDFVFEFSTGNQKHRKVFKYRWKK